MMKLYSNSVDPFSHRCRIVLFEKGMDFEVIDVDFNNKSEDLNVLSPYADAPVLVERDNYMKDLDLKYPEYKLKKHKGYPTKEHMDLIKIHGIKDFYRKSFKPVRDLIN